jgi:hypothetical protein
LPEKPPHGAVYEYPLEDAELLALRDRVACNVDPGTGRLLVVPTSAGPVPTVAPPPLHAARATRHRKADAFPILIRIAIVNPPT